MKHANLLTPSLYDHMDGRPDRLIAQAKNAVESLTNDGHCMATIGIDAVIGMACHTSEGDPEQFAADLDFMIDQLTRFRQNLGRDMFNRGQAPKPVNVLEAAMLAGAK